MKHLISGGVSGGISDPESNRARKHADIYYEEIRKNNSDIQAIADNTGLPYQKIKMIKNYLFLDKHQLETGIDRFDPTFEIAESWQRLAFDFEHVKPHDITLLGHELLEMKYYLEGYSQNDAHILASKKYDYSKESREYYESLKNKLNDIKSIGSSEKTIKTKEEDLEL